MNKRLIYITFFGLSYLWSVGAMCQTTPIGISKPFWTGSGGGQVINVAISNRTLSTAGEIFSGDLDNTASPGCVAWSTWKFDFKNSSPSQYGRYSQVITISPDKHCDELEYGTVFQVLSPRTFSSIFSWNISNPILRECARTYIGNGKTVTSTYNNQVMGSVLVAEGCTDERDTNTSCSISLPNVIEHGSVSSSNVSGHIAQVDGTINCTKPITVKMYTSSAGVTGEGLLTGEGGSIKSLYSIIHGAEQSPSMTFSVNGLSSFSIRSILDGVNQKAGDYVGNVVVTVLFI